MQFINEWIKEWGAVAAGIIAVGGVFAFLPKLLRWLTRRRTGSFVRVDGVLLPRKTVRTVFRGQEARETAKVYCGGQCNRDGNLIEMIRSAQRDSWECPVCGRKATPWPKALAWIKHRAASWFF